MLWLIAAVGSAVFAGLTSILAKCGIRKTVSERNTSGFYVYHPWNG